MGISSTGLWRPGRLACPPVTAKAGPPYVTDDPELHGLNLGAVVHLTGPFSLLGSFGRGLNRRQTIFYSALKL